VEEMTDELSLELQQTYEDRLTVKYIDTRKAKLSEYPQVFQLIRMGYGFPIVAVNGKPRFAGGINPEMIKEIIQQITNND